MSTGTLIDRAVLLTAIFATACEVHDLRDVEFPSSCDSRALPLCDVRETECGNTYFEYVACLRERDGAVIPERKRVPPAMVPSTPPLTSSISAGLQRALVLADLLEDSYVLRDGFKSHASPFSYSSRDRTLLISDDVSSLSQFEVIGAFVHESVHAMQDAEHDFAALLARFGDDEDRRFALEAIVEGEASFVEEMVRAAFNGRSIFEIYDGVSFEPFRGLGIDQSARRSSAYAFASLDFSRWSGEFYVAEAWLTGQQAEVDRLFENPPRSTSAVLSGYSAPVPADSRLELEPPLGLDGSVLIESPALGRWFYEVALLRVATENFEQARTAGAAWDGDRFFVYRALDGSIAVAWIVKNHSEAEAQSAESVYAATPLGYRASRRFAAIGSYFVFVAAENESRLDGWMSSAEAALR